jgi:hypothetical protein
MARYRIAAGIAIAAFLFTQAMGGGAAAPSAIHSIVEMNEQCLIGGAQDQKWIGADKFQATVKSPQTFTLYTLEGPAKEVVLSRNAESECHPRWSVKSDSGPRNGIAIQSPSWNPMPRAPKPIDVKDPTYVKVVSDVLKSAGIKNPEVKITQAYSIDLDGDGNQEVVIVANRFAKGVRESSGIPSQTSPGDYTLVMVRKTIDGKDQNIFIVKATWPTGVGGGLPRANHLSAIADLNGDGHMELVIYNAYFEGSGSDVLQIKGNKVTGVLSCACEH